jgi:hypothetical protein
MSRLVEAIRAKYSTPQAALRALGLDTTLLNPEEDSLARKVKRILADLNKLAMDADLLGEPEHMRSDPRGEGGGGGGEIEGGVPRRGMDRFGLRRSSKDSIEPKIEEMQEEVLGASDDEDDELYDPLREHLRKNGLDEESVERACELAKDHVRRRRSNGHDRHADDFLPKNHLGRSGPGGRFAGPRDSQHASGESDVAASREYMRQIYEEGDRRAVDEAWENPNGSMEAIVDPGLDARRRRGGRDRQAVDSIHRLARRFGNEAGCRPDRSRSTSDAAPSSAVRARFANRFADVKRIGDASSDGELPPWADKIGGFA